MIIAPFRAFLRLVENFQQAWRDIKHAREGYEQAWRDIKHAREGYEFVRKTHVRLKAAVRAQEAWRSRSMVPTCPHCHEAIFPEDGFGGSAINKKTALEQRSFKAKARKP